MSKVKIKRQSISLDMTAMCDMAFLLLTFFILTAKMKTPEPASFDVPASVATKKLPDKDVIRISISAQGGVFFSIGEQGLRREIIDVYSKTFNMPLSDNQKLQFELMETWGMPSSDLPVYLSMSDTKKKKYVQKGIPVDSTNNELKRWVAVAKSINKELRVAIKGDKDANYENFQKVIDSMRDMNLLHFSLITNLETKPSTL